MLACITAEDLDKIAQVKAIIEKDFKYQLTQQQLAQKVNTNESKLRRGFKLVVQMTIYEYHTYIRIEKAKELLVSTTLPTKTIASRVGLDNRNFNRQFKKITKFSPLVWRRFNAHAYSSKALNAISYFSLQSIEKPDSPFF